MVAKVNAINTKVPSISGLVFKTEYDSDKQDLDKNFVDVNQKKPNTSGLDRKTDLNSKDIKIENKIASATGLVTTAALNTKVA